MFDTKVDPVEFAKALADDTRQRIMKSLCCRELCVSDVVAEIGLAQPTISHHLQILKNADLVLSRKDGKQVYYTLNQSRVSVCCGVLMSRFAPEVQSFLPIETLSMS